MIRRCCICRNIFGRKEPFSDTSETTGICETCFLPYMEKVQKQIKEYRARVPQRSGRRP